VAITNANQITGTAVYTDGLGHDKKIGAAAILFKNGRTQTTLKYFLGPETDHTVYEAEAVAIMLALHILTGLKKKLNKVTIGTDNQAVLLGLQNQQPKPGHHLMDKIHDALEDFQVTQARIRGERVEGYRKGVGRMRLEDRSKGWKEWKLKMHCKVTFIWTPGHEGIVGNEEVDEAAKDTATGRSSKSKNLPVDLLLTGGRTTASEPASRVERGSWFVWLYRGLAGLKEMRERLEGYKGEARGTKEMLEGRRRCLRDEGDA